MAEHDSVDGDPGVKEDAPEWVTKKVQFFRLAFHWRDSVLRPPPDVDWRDRIAGQSGMLTFGQDVTYEGQASGDGAVLLGRKVRSGDFRRRTQETFEPLEDDTADSYLARVNVAAFCSCNAFAIIAAAAGAPGTPAVAALANHLAPEFDGQWVTVALTAEAEIERFRSSRKIDRMEMKVDVLPSGLGLDVQPASLGEAMSHVSDLVGAELSLELKIQVKKPSQNPEGQRNLHRLIANALGLVGVKKLKARSRDPEVGEALMNLMVHNMVSSIEIEAGAGPESAVRAIQDVRDAYDDEVARLVRRIENEG